jgi:hypothetical protein
MIRPFMIQYGYNPTFYESWLGTLYAYYDLYDAFMRDVYLVIALSGLLVFFSVICNQYFNICH